MLRWLHTLGYREHVATKSRRFSTTLAELGARRAAWCRQHSSRCQPAGTINGAEYLSGGEDCGERTVITWRLQRVGHEHDGDRWLAVSAAVRAREHRIIARTEYADLIVTENDWAAA